MTTSDGVTGGYGSLRHRLVAMVSGMLANVTYTSRRGLTRGLRRRGGLGWVPAWLTGSSAPTPEEQFFLSLDLKGEVVYDIGAFHGLFTLFFAQRAAQVVAFEPNPASRRRLVDNVRLNSFSNVIVRDVGVGAAPSRSTLTFDPRMSGGATVAATLQEEQRHSRHHVESAEITVVRLDDEIRTSSLPAPTFAKIDVEGMELPALQGMRETLETCRPRLYIEMHGATMEEKRHNARDVVAFLAECGYRRIAHVESGTELDAATTEIAAQGHLYCVP